MAALLCKVTRRPWAGDRLAAINAGVVALGATPLAPGVYLCVDGLVDVEDMAECGVSVLRGFELAEIRTALRASLDAARLPNNQPWMD